jgi:alpha-tubulin suppressor-like RCC1 family protein
MKVSAGNNTTCVIDEAAFPQNIMAGHLSCWGELVPTGTDATLFADVAVGNASACAVTVAGTVWCWGANGSGQLGDGTNKSATTPVVVSGLGTYKADHVAAGFRSFCTNTKDGLVFCWGDNSHQQLGYVGLDSKTAVVVAGIGNATNISSGLYHGCALVSDGTVYCWGDNSKKQILNSATTRLGVTQVSQAAVVSKVASGGYENCFLMTDTKLNCIGDNADSQSPGLLSGTFLDVAVGLNSVCVVQTEFKQAACFGSNSNTKLGRTGLKSSVPSVIPTMEQVMTYPGFKSIAVGDEHACAVKDNAYLYCWGANNAGQLGSSFGFPKAFAKVSVTVSGKTNVGETLTAAISANEPQATVAFSWNKANDAKLPGSAVNDASSSTYVPVSSDTNKYLNAVAVFSKWGITSAGMRSENYGPVGPAIRILVTAVPTVLGKTKVGQVLSAKPGVWEAGVRLSYQWYRGTAKISNATSATYKLVAADFGKQISVAVSGTKKGLPTVINRSLKTGKITR